MPRRICWNRFDGPLPPGAKSVMRPSKFGNPWKVGPDGSRQDVVHRYGLYLWSHGELLLAARRELVGFDLACSCPLGEPCHADALLVVANSCGPR